MSAFNVVFVRDLRVAFRRWSELGYPLIFFIIVATMFPLALSPTTSQLREVGTGVLWVAAFLSSLLAVDGLVSQRCRRRQLGAATAEPGADDAHRAREARCSCARHARTADLCSSR